MKNIYVGLLAAVACTYSLQAAANLVNDNNLNLVFTGENSSFSESVVSPEISLNKLSAFNPNNAVKLAAVCSVGGGGCAGLKFGEGNNSMNLDDDSQCSDEGYVKSCPEGKVPDENNRCPHNKSYFKCRDANTSCDDGYSKSACNSTTQVQTASYTNEAGSTCYQCRDKTCSEGGYTASLTSCQNGTAVSFANKTCYKDVSAKTCENGGYKSSIPTNNKCDSTTYCSNTCYTNCKQPTCEESGFLSTCPTNHDCDTVTSGTYGRTCYKDKGQPTCEDGNYKSGVPTNQVCTPVSYSGRTCYKDCYQPQCSAGGYLDACPTNQSGTTVTYYGRNCVKDCKVNETEIACEIGSVLYEDKKCYSSTTKTPIAVVFDTGDHLAVALEQNTAPWAGKTGDITGLAQCSSGTLLACGIDGKSNTETIINFGKANYLTYPAAEYCNKYTTTGTSAGEWFLPSFDELNKIYSNKSIINTALNQLEKSPLSEASYWSSTYQNSNSAWYLGMQDGKSSANYLSGPSHNVRPVIQYVESTETEITCKFGSILYQDLKCYSKTKKTPIGVVIDNLNKRALALTEATVTSTIKVITDNVKYAEAYNAAGVYGWNYATENDLDIMKENVDTLNIILASISGAIKLDTTSPGYVGEEDGLVLIESSGSNRVNRCMNTSLCIQSVNTTADLSDKNFKIRLVLFYGDCGSYQTSIPTNQKCTSVIYNGNTCYKDCRAYTCSDGGYQSSNKFQCATGTLTSVSYKGLTCYHCVGTSTPKPIEKCEDYGYLTPGSTAACACTYGNKPVIATTSSGTTLSCVRCGTYAECGNSSVGFQCLKCNYKADADPVNPL